MSLFQICPDCGTQSNIEPYDFCGVCGHEWSSEEIRSSTPVPVERAVEQCLQQTNGGLCVHCGVPEWRHMSAIGHVFKSPTISC
jgi:hypothetical protein